MLAATERLYRVANHLAVKARAKAARRRVQERKAVSMPVAPFGQSLQAPDDALDQPDLVAHPR